MAGFYVLLILRTGVYFFVPTCMSIIQAGYWYHNGLTCLFWFSHVVKPRCVTVSFSVHFFADMHDNETFGRRDRNSYFVGKA